jgi:hypothetical protein
MDPIELAKYMEQRNFQSDALVVKLVEQLKNVTKRKKQPQVDAAVQV